jgi:6-phosphogluconolactonase
MISVEVRSDPEEVADRAAELVAEAVRAAVDAGDRFAWAISGGTTPVPMFRTMSRLDLPWRSIETWQVDERVVPLGDPQRNRTTQSDTLPPELLEGVRWMPVEDPDPEASALRYSAGMPERFDVVQLGLGADGHTASLLPGDPVLDVHDRDVGLTRPGRGLRRMTLTLPGLARGRRAIWVVTGAEKGDALAKLLAGDASIPAARVSIQDQVVVADRAAAPSAEAS